MQSLWLDILVDHGTAKGEGDEMGFHALCGALKEVVASYKNARVVPHISKQPPGSPPHFGVRIGYKLESNGDGRRVVYCAGCPKAENSPRDSVNDGCTSLSAESVSVSVRGVIVAAF